MLRGCAHGDLHGRNILVGLVRDQAMWPTVFDYEDMGPCNLIGWDFVKLETELKIRAYLDVFGGGDPGAVHPRVQDFEIAPEPQTEQCHRDRAWPEIGDPAAPEDRLRTILLMIRRMAAQQLGDQPRPAQRLAGGVLLPAGLLRRVHQPVREPPARASGSAPWSRPAWPRRG